MCSPFATVNYIHLYSKKQLYSYRALINCTLIALFEQRGKKAARKRGGKSIQIQMQNTATVFLVKYEHAKQNVSRLSPVRWDSNIFSFMYNTVCASKFETRLAHRSYLTSDHDISGNGHTVHLGLDRTCVFPSMP